MPRQQPKRKRWERASTTSTFEMDDPDQRPIKQHGLAADGRQEEVWIRWRRLEPRQRRRTEQRNANQTATQTIQSERIEERLV
jgi:hypothetical protein